MNIDCNHHQTFIAAPDDSAKVVHEAIPPPAQPNIVLPGPTDNQSGVLRDGRGWTHHHSGYYGMALVWRGLRLLGVTIGIAAAWFVIAWVHYGRMPLGLCEPKLRFATGIGNQPEPIMPSVWLLAVLGLLALISFTMMFLGNQDANPRLNFKKDIEPNKPAQSTGKPAPDR